MGHAQVVIMENIVVTEQAGINFGLIHPQSGQTGKVTISPSGDVNASNSTHNNGLPTHAAHFVASGTPAANVLISFMNGSLNGTGDPMDINNFTHDAGVTPSFDGSGVLDFHVGADVNLNLNQQSGSYNGTYTITLNYQ
ncbi:MAG: DUF4402 domain-containing protein [Alphaproteobacteria bacterium]|nr:DUF4402 domain-containing protein [Alphaproteobacteria bacterium]